MTAIDPTTIDRRARTLGRISKADGWFKVIGLPFMTPLLRAIAGDNPKAQMKQLWITLFVPILSIIGFLVLWGVLAPQVQTSLGAVPGPAQVWIRPSCCIKMPCARAKSARPFMNGRTSVTRN